MSVVATDNFNRANGPLGTGGNYTSANGTPSSLVITLDAITPGMGGNDWDVQFWNALTWANDQWSQVTLGSVDQANGAAIGVGVRAATTGGGSFYYLVAFPAYSVYQVGKNVNGVNTGLNNIGVNPAIGDVIYLEIQGTTLKSKINGVVQDTRTVTDFASGSAGPSGFDIDSALNAGSWIGGNFLAPSPASLSASSGAQGATLATFTVTGTNCDVNGASTLSFSGSGITVNSYGTRNATTITASITIAGNATASARDVIITNSQGQAGTLSASFTVTSSSSLNFSDRDSYIT